MARGLLWNVTSFGIGSHVTKQKRKVAPTWSWASVVLSKSNRVFFPAGDDDTFIPDERLQFLDTEPPSEQSNRDFPGEFDAIWVKSAVAHAIATLETKGLDRNVNLVFKRKTNDKVVKSAPVSVFKDIFPEPQDEVEAVAQDWACLLISSRVETDSESSEQTTYYCMVVLEPSANVPDA